MQRWTAVPGNPKLRSLNHAYAWAKLIGVVSCLTAAACGGRTRTDSSWVGGDSLSSASSVTTPESSTSVRSPVAPDTWVEREPTASQDGPTTPPSSTACGGHYEITYPTAFTFGDHADMFEVVSPDTGTWCLKLEEAYLWPSAGFRGSGFGLRFADTESHSWEVPFDLTVRGLTGVSFRVGTFHEDVAPAMSEVRNPPEPDMLARAIWLQGQHSRVSFGEYYVPFSDFNGGHRRAFSPELFHALQFHVFDELPPRRLDRRCASATSPFTMRAVTAR